MLFNSLELLSFLVENRQLADKIYLKSGKLSDAEMGEVLDVTGGDNYTKLMADFYYHLKDYIFTIPYKYRVHGIIGYVDFLYGVVKGYNKNVFPIKGFDIINNEDSNKLICALDYRDKIIKLFKIFPSIAFRNMKGDIRKERDCSEMTDYYDKLDYFHSLFLSLDNRVDKEKIYNKLFKSGVDVDYLIDFMGDKSNLFDDVEFGREEIEELSKHEDFKITYDNEDVMILEVYSHDAMRAIGCNSFWCFSYPDGDWYWTQYTSYGFVYVLVNLLGAMESGKMYVITEPIVFERGYESNMFDMANYAVDEPAYVLEGLFGEDYMDIVNKYLNFE